MSRDQPPAPEPAQLRTERLAPGHNLDERWGSWWVFDLEGAPVGIIHEMHDFDGERFGPASYAVAHNPTGAAGQALWNSEQHATIPDALDALAQHLTRDQPTDT